MERGEMWRVCPDPTEGHEQRGQRPVLIISPTAFNHFTRLPVVLPVTRGGDFARIAGFAVTLEDTGTLICGVVRCDQPRTIDIGARHGKLLEKAPEAIVN